MLVEGQALAREDRSSARDAGTLSIYTQRGAGWLRRRTGASWGRAVLAGSYAGVQGPMRFRELRLDGALQPQQADRCLFMEGMRTSRTLSWRRCCPRGNWPGFGATGVAGGLPPAWS